MSVMRMTSRFSRRVLWPFLRFSVNLPCSQKAWKIKLLGRIFVAEMWSSLSKQFWFQLSITRQSSAMNVRWKSHWCTQDVHFVQWMPCVHYGSVFLTYRHTRHCFLTLCMGVWNVLLTRTLWRMYAPWHFGVGWNLTTIRGIRLEGVAVLGLGKTICPLNASWCKGTSVLLAGYPTSRFRWWRGGKWLNYWQRVFICNVLRGLLGYDLHHWVTWFGSLQTKSIPYV